MKFYVESNHNYNKSETGVMADQIIRFKGSNPKKQSVDFVHASSLRTDSLSYL